MIVADRLRRNRKITITTSATVSISSNCTSATEARIVVVRSVRICTFTDAGSDACKRGSSVLIRSTTAMMLAPGWRWMLTITAGVRFIQAACLDVLRVVDHVGDVGQRHRRAVAIRDDQRLVILALVSS